MKELKIIEPTENNSTQNYPKSTDCLIIHFRELQIQSNNHNNNTNLSKS